MTKAYVVQVSTQDSGFLYLGLKRKLCKVPKFFISAPGLRTQIKLCGYGKGINSVRSPSTIVIVISDLEKGLKDSSASSMSLDTFLASDFSSKRALSNPNAVYKIRRDDGSLVRTNRRHTFGTAWSRAGDLRTYLSNTLNSSMAFEIRFKGAHVLEIVMAEDGVLVKEVIEHPIKDFYLASPACSKRYADLGL